VTESVKLNVDEEARLKIFLDSRQIGFTIDWLQVILSTVILSTVILPAVILSIVILSRFFCL
jgi:hypothetical protein